MPWDFVLDVVILFVYVKNDPVLRSVRVIGAKDQQVGRLVGFLIVSPSEIPCACG